MSVLAGSANERLDRSRAEAHAASHDVCLQKAPGHRERKRQATIRALKSAALELTLERGLENVTVVDIADRAGVAPRTFSNYFSSKQEAIVGVSHDWVGSASAALRNRPAHESPVVALAHALSESVTSTEVVALWWEQRDKIIRRYPVLLPWQLGALVAVEDELTEALAQRLGVDPEVNPYSRIAVASALAVLRVTTTAWHRNEFRGSLSDALADAFEYVAAGMPPRTSADPCNHATS